MVRIDVSEVRAIARRAQQLFRAMPGKMLRIGQFAAKYERGSHAYTNRTDMLEASTWATIAVGSDETTLTLTMGMPYASYVNDLGYSNIGEAAGIVQRELGIGFAAIGDELGGM